MKKIFFLLSFIFLPLIFAGVSYAGKTPGPKPNSSIIKVASTLAKNKRAVTTSFQNLSTVKKVTYILMYEGNGIGQGAEGSFAPGKKKTITRTFTLGTCSNKVCRYHKNVKNLQLEVKTQYKNGRSSKQTYKIKT